MIVVDLVKFGYNLVSIIGVDMKLEKIFEVVNKFKEFDFVKYVYLISGDYMIMVEVWVRDGEYFFEIILEKIGRIDGVMKVCLVIIFEKMK